MRRLFLAASVVTIAAAVVHCSKTTELVVAVDTDLVPASEVDRIQVTVDGPRGRVFDKPADVLAPSALPLTLGVAAGGADDAEVHVVATAFKSGVAVARTEVVARFAPGESRLVQVSICKSCGLTCGRNLGSSLPEWDDSLPAKHACDTTFADAGGFDSGKPLDDGGVTGDGSALVDGGSDGSIEPAPPADCQNRCAHGSECTKSGACHIVGAASCDDPVVVGLDGGAFFGTLCSNDAGTYATGCGNPHFGFVFEPPASGSGHDVTLLVTSQKKSAMTGGPLEPGCSIGGGCSFPGASDGVIPYPDSVPGKLYGIGFRPNVDGGACQDLTLTFTPK